MGSIPDFYKERHNETFRLKGILYLLYAQMEISPLNYKAVNPFLRIHFTFVSVFLQALFLTNYHNWIYLYPYNNDNNHDEINIHYHKL